jgi:hypothetical protein
MNSTPACPSFATETLGADCCGCLVVDLVGDRRRSSVKIVCNECGEVVRMLPAEQVEAAMRELAETDTIT